MTYNRSGEYGRHSWEYLPREYYSPRLQFVGGSDGRVVLRPHQFRTQVGTIDGTALPQTVLDGIVVPKARFELESLETQEILVEHARTEVSWYGFVEVKEGREFDIYDVCLPHKQKVHGSRTQPTAEGIADLVKALYESVDPEDADTIDEKLDRLLFWGHSHVYFDTVPSPQDDDEAYHVGVSNKAPFFIRAIANKRGKLRVDLFLFEENLRFLDIPWEPFRRDNEDLRTRVAEQFKTQVIETADIDYEANRHVNNPWRSQYGRDGLVPIGPQQSHYPVWKPRNVARPLKSNVYENTRLLSATRELLSFRVLLAVLFVMNVAIAICGYQANQSLWWGLPTAITILGWPLYRAFKWWQARSFHDSNLGQAPQTVEAVHSTDHFSGEDL